MQTFLLSRFVDVEQKQRETHIKHLQATNHVKIDNHTTATPKQPMSSRLKRAKISPEETGDVHVHSDTPNGYSDRQSPTNSNRTELTNKSVKRVAFTDNLLVENQHSNKREGSLSPSRALTTSPSDRAKAKRQREKNMRKKLLAKMSAAEVSTSISCCRRMCKSVSSDGKYMYLVTPSLSR